MSLVESVGSSCQVKENGACDGDVLAEQRGPKALCHLVNQNVAGAGGAWTTAGWEWA